MLPQTTIPVSLHPREGDELLFRILELVAFRAAAAHGLPLVQATHTTCRAGTHDAEEHKIGIHIRGTSLTARWDEKRATICEILDDTGKNLAKLCASKYADLDVEDKTATEKGFTASVVLTVRRLYTSFRLSLPNEGHHYEQKPQRCTEQQTYTDALCALNNNRCVDAAKKLESLMWGMSDATKCDDLHEMANALRNGISHEVETVRTKLRKLHADVLQEAEAEAKRGRTNTNVKPQ